MQFNKKNDVDSNTVKPKQRSGTQVDIELDSDWMEQLMKMK